MTALRGLAIADFRERVRRPAYTMMLISAIGLGWLALPARDVHWVVLDAGGARGLYTSGYVGLVTALTSALWLTLVGFYLVRESVARDERTGVGPLLAATPLRSAVYLGGKLLSNVLVLGSMAAVLAATALVLQLVRGESRTVDLIGLLTPFLVIALPMLVLTAAAAVLFETTPLLRGGAGNVLWFFVWMIGAIGGQSADAPLGGIGMPSPPVGSLGLVYVDSPLRTFEWPGLDLSAAFVGGRLLVSALAIAVALLPALWFHRFDRPAFRSDRSGPPPPAVYKGLPRVAPRRGFVGGRLVAGEFRVLVQGTRWWWWLGAAIPLLPIAWIWPVLLWSRLGTQSRTAGPAAILAAYPAPRRRLLAEWVAGIALTVLVSASAAVRLAAVGDGPGLAAWAAGALFIPALALALGTLSGAPRVFQAVYTALWYLMINGLRLPPWPSVGLAFAGFTLAYVATMARGRFQVWQTRR